MLAGDTTSAVSDVSSLEVPAEVAASKPRSSELLSGTTDLPLSLE
ncbi:hypothetical protein [Natronorubrum halophilum]|nr:hypothetical protein [Natronorubrum halophilum]